MNLPPEIAEQVRAAANTSSHSMSAAPQPEALPTEAPQ